eukprot:m.54674 g.54674  ORF g.54674 m.54674 type:complete len:1076 (+) comp21955_c0_seq1:406-3633(+)
MAAALTQEACMQLLQFGTSEAPLPLHVPTLDLLVRAMYETSSPQQKKTASDVLTQFKSHEMAWTRCHQILEESTYDGTKFFALQVLDDVIKSKWTVLPQKQSEGMKQFIVEMVIQKSSSFDTLKAQSVLIKKLDMILIQIVKQEWPDKWPTFISDLVGASKNSESLCENNMIILKMLSEEVFDNENTMTESKANRLKSSMRGQFGSVFDLCLFVMKHSECASLLQATLSTLLGFMSWIDMNYIFSTSLIGDLVGKFFNVPIFRNITLQCISEIAAITAEETKQKQLEMFTMTMQRLRDILPPQTDIAAAYAKGTTDDQNFVNSLALFFATFLKNHGSLLEGPATQEYLATALEYLVNLSKVDEIEIFKICLEYWNHLAAGLFNETPVPNFSPAGGLMLNQQPSSRLAFYAPVLVQVRMIMVCRMAKPEEVLVVQREDEVVREVVKDSDAMEQYKFMRETLVYLTHLDVDNTEEIMTKKLLRQVDLSEYSWNNLNTLCWAIGSISGAMNEENEKRFLVTVIKDLLGLCEKKHGKNHKAIIASNIMYIVGQYPRFLRAHWKFLKTVVTKLFEFMHESHEGVQDMACDTFIKIAQKCRKHFVTTQVGDYFPFIDDILQSMHSIIMDLEQHQVHTFYEAIGHMIYAQSNPSVRAQLIKQLMETPNTIWQRILSQAAQDPNALCQQNVVDELVNILKMNVRACTSIRNDFISQLSVIYMDMLLIYKHMSEYIANMIAQQGEAAVKQPIVKSMRLVKRESLNLIGLWISMSEDPTVVMTKIIPPLLEAVLIDYKNSIPQARDEQVLATMVKIVKKLQGNITSQVLNIFTAIFESTISMISKDFIEFPEHRVAFYDLLLVITKHCFQAFAELNEQQFQMVINAIVWGLQHPIRHVAETSLRCMKVMLDNVARQPQFAQTFYSKFYLSIMEHLFQVMTDSVHYGELELHAVILADLFAILEAGDITAPLNTAVPTMPNQQFVLQFIGGKLKEAFPHLQDSQLEIITQGFVNYNADMGKFKQHLRDFLVESKEVAGEDMTNIYFVERKQKADAAQASKYQMFRDRKITGMINPHALGGDDEMDN